MNLSDKIDNMIFPVALPLVLLTEENPNKSIRVMAFLLSFFLIPCLILGAFLIVLYIVIATFEDI